MNQPTADGVKTETLQSVYSEFANRIVKMLRLGPLDTDQIQQRLGVRQARVLDILRAFPNLFEPVEYGSLTHWKGKPMLWRLTESDPQPSSQ